MPALARQVNSGSGFGTSLAVAFLSNVLSGSLLVYGANGHSNDSAFTDSVDTAELGRTHDAGAAAGFGDLRYVQNATAGAHTATRTQASDDQGMVIAEFPGGGEGQPITTGGILDQATSAANFSTAPNSGASGTTSQAAELIIGFVLFESAGANMVPQALYSEEVEIVAAGSSCELMSQMVNAIAAYTASGTLTLTNWAQMVVTFKCNASPPPIIHVGRAARQIRNRSGLPL